ncbi:MAG: hypothetical protein AAGK78_13650 [Planctomycetota bacterium]
MRNDVKPVIPDAAGNPTIDADANKPVAGASFDDVDASGVRRESGDSVDPAGPKRSQAPGVIASGGAVTDPSGTTGPVSRSNDRTSTTTGGLGGGQNRDLERSARQSAAPDINALPVPTGDTSISVGLLAAVLAIVMAVLGLITFLSWPSDVETPSDQTAGVPVSTVE